jgi:hypothetical protein
MQCVLFIGQSAITVPPSRLSGAPHVLTSNNAGVFFPPQCPPIQPVATSQPTTRGSQWVKWHSMRPNKLAPTPSSPAPPDPLCRSCQSSSLQADHDPHSKCRLRRQHGPASRPNRLCWHEPLTHPAWLGPYRAATTDYILRSTAMSCPDITQYSPVPDSTSISPRHPGHCPHSRFRTP